MEVVFWSILAYAFVFGTIAVFVYVLFELSPFAHHEDIYHRLR